MQKLKPLVILVAVGAKLCNAQDEELPNLNYIGAGYDILKGNPHSTTTFIDPGWRLAIFDLAEPGTRTLVSGGTTYIEPKGVEALSCSTCSFQFDTRTSSSAGEYRDSLRVSVDADFAGWGQSFKASVDYNSVEESSETKNSMFVETMATCSFYCASIAAFDPPPVSSNFAEAVRRLPVEFDDAAYSKFIDEFGTHFANTVEMGGLIGQRTEMSASSLQTLEDLGISVEIGAEFSYLGATGSIDAATDIEKTAAEQFQQEQLSTASFNYGGEPVFPEDTSNLNQEDRDRWFASVREDPLPLRFGLGMLSDLLTDINVPDDVNIVEKQINLVLALSKYCATLETSGQIECSDRDFEVESMGSFGNANSSTAEHFHDGPRWEGLGQPIMTGINMWFGENGLESIQPTYRENLILHRETLSWSAAERECQRSDAELASVSNSAEQTALATVVQRAQNAGTLLDDFIFFGLSDQEFFSENRSEIVKYGIYAWNDGTETTYENWAANHPDLEDTTSDCAGIHVGSLQWEDLACSSNHPYICKWPRAHGVAPQSSDILRQPIRFTPQPGDFITQIEVCALKNEPERIGSMAFATTGEPMSPRFTFETHDEGVECMSEIGGYALDTFLSFAFSPELKDWRDCQRACQAIPGCDVWNKLYIDTDFADYTDYCLLGQGFRGEINDNEYVAGCATRSCRDCSSFQPAVEIDESSCQTFDFSDRFGLTHLSGAFDSDESVISGLSFYGYAEQSIQFEGLDTESIIDDIRGAESTEAPNGGEESSATRSPGGGAHLAIGMVVIAALATRLN